MEGLKLVVVTGANKGIGLAIVENLVQKAYRVVMACRSVELGQKSRQEILSKYKVDEDKLGLLELDISSTNSIDNFVKNFSEVYNKADVLVNNAAIAFKGDAFDENVVQDTFRPNFFGTVDLSEKFLPLLNQNGKIVTLGSRAGLSKILKSEDLKQRFLKEEITREELFQLVSEFINGVRDNTYESNGWPKSGYGMSKLAINTYTRVLARNPLAVQNGIQVYTCCPGYVNTDMTSHKGVLTVEQGAETPVWLVELPHQINNEFQGQFFYDKQRGTI